MFSAGQFIYIHWPPKMTSAAERLVTEFYNKLIPPETWPFRIIEVSPTTVTIGKEGIQNTVSIKLHWCHRRNTQNDKLCTLQTNQSTNETTKSTKSKDRIQQKNPLTCPSNTQSITLGVMWAKAITFETFCTGTDIYLLTTWLNHSNASLNIL